MNASLPAGDAALPRLTAGGYFAALCAAVILFDAVLALGLGLDWALVGLLGLSPEVGLGGGMLALGLALAAGVWLFRRACRAERELAREGIA